ncbi:MAG: hypothetical protein WC091_19175, partial [Sulfuricellaceae bacterium]
NQWLEFFHYLIYYNWLHVFLWVFRSAARLGVEILTMAFTMECKSLIFRYEGLLFWGKIILPPLASPCYARAAAQRKWLWGGFNNESKPGKPEQKNIYRRGAETQRRRDFVENDMASP